MTHDTRDPVIMSASSILAACLFLTGCITPGHTQAGYPAVHVLPVLAGEKGYHLDNDNYKLALSEGVPDSLFTTDARGHYLSREAEIQAARILDQKRNPMPAAVPVKKP